MGAVASILPGIVDDGQKSGTFTISVPVAFVWRPDIAGEGKTWSIRNASAF